MSKVHYTDDDLVDLRKNGVETSNLRRLSNARRVAKPVKADASEDESSLRELVEKLAKLPEALLNLANRPTPEISVNVPEAPESKPMPAPNVIVNAAKPCAWKFTVERDSMGKPVSYIAEPME